MQVVRSIADVRDHVAKARASGAIIGFVPTMGFLHEGHLSLIDEARRAGADYIVVSIFVNPTQFGPNEDLEKYPRDEANDTRMLEGRDVDLLFLPAMSDMYPASAATRVVVGAVAEPLEGDRRPGHFSGVATVVAKLFNIVMPDVAAFGRKDAQQCAVVERLVVDLDFPIRLVFGETVREHDGLALSSRNTYLNEQHRSLAPALHRALRAGEAALEHGAIDQETVETLMRRIANEVEGIEVDYLALVDPMTFQPPEDFHRDLLLVGAIRVGNTRLIDNIRVPRAKIPHTKIER